MPLPAAIQEELDNLAVLTDRTERVEYLISLSESYQHPGEHIVPRSPENRVPGCESEVFFAAKLEGPNIVFRYAVDNPQGISAMALAVVLEKGLGSPASSLRELSESIVFDLFGRELSMGKSLGLTNMVKMLRQEPATA